MGLEAVLGLECLLTEGAQLAARSSKQRQGLETSDHVEGAKKNYNKKSKFD